MRGGGHAGLAQTDRDLLRFRSASLCLGGTGAACVSSSIASSDAVFGVDSAEIPRRIPLLPHVRRPVAFPSAAAARLITPRLDARSAARAVLSLDSSCILEASARLDARSTARAVLSLGSSSIMEASARGGDTVLAVEPRSEFT